MTRLPPSVKAFFKTVFGECLPTSPAVAVATPRVSMAIAITSCYLFAAQIGFSSVHCCLSDESLSSLILLLFSRENNRLSPAHVDARRSCNPRSSDSSSRSQEKGSERKASDPIP